MRCGSRRCYSRSELPEGLRQAAIFFFSSRRRHTRCSRDWSSDVCSSDLPLSATRRGGQGERSVCLSDRPTPILDVRAYSFWYGATQALFDVTVAIPRRAVTALIGPSGCGKSTPRNGDRDRKSTRLNSSHG